QLVVALEVRLDLADPAEAEVVAAEAPRADETEREVARRIVEVGELPVEDTDEAVLVDGDVADAEVAVDDDRLARLRLVLAQPPEPELDRRVGLAGLVELFDESLHCRRLKVRKPLARDRVDLRELFRELERQA